MVIIFYFCVDLKINSPRIHNVKTKSTLILGMIDSLYHTKKPKDSFSKIGSYKRNGLESLRRK